MERYASMATTLRDVLTSLEAVKIKIIEVDARISKLEQEVRIRLDIIEREEKERNTRFEQRMEETDIAVSKNSSMLTSFERSIAEQQHAIKDIVDRGQNLTRVFTGILTPIVTGLVVFIVEHFFFK